MLHHGSRQLCPVLVMKLFGGCIGLGPVKRQDTYRPVDTFQWHSQSRAEFGGLSRVRREAGFDRRVAIHDGPRVLRDPPAEAGPYRDLQR